jgi:hypothetical protein
MRRALRGLRLVLIAFAVGMLPFYLAFRGRGEMTVGISPDGRFRISVDERRAGIDRNFLVLLTDLSTNRTMTIYKSNDQVSSINRERFVWSADSSKVVLVGDKYWVDPGSELEGGDVVFLMFDLASRKLYCNADYGNELPRIPAADVVQIFGADRLKVPD